MAANCQGNLAKCLQVTCSSVLGLNPITIDFYENDNMKLMMLKLILLLYFDFRPGYQKVVPTEGMPISKDPNTKGDLIIQFNIEFPNQLNPEQKRMLKEALLLPP